MLPAGASGSPPRFEKLPWIPTEEEWQAVLEAARAEPLRNRVMFTMADDAGLRREEVCLLETGDHVLKGSTKAHLLAGKSNLQRLLQEVLLSDEERAAVEDGIAAYEKQLVDLADVPTPAGPTPRQLTDQGRMSSQPRRRDHE